MTTKTTRVAFALVPLCALLVSLSPVGIAVRAKSEPPVQPPVRITPPAPLFSDKERVAELMQRLALWPTSLLVSFQHRTARHVTAR